MARMVRNTSEQLEDMQVILTQDEKKKIGVQIGSALLAGGFWLIGKIHQLAFPGYESITGIIMLIGALIVVIPVFIKAIQGIASISPKNIMDELVAIALLAALAKGDYPTAILIPLLLSVAHFLEERSIMGTSAAIESLKTLQSKKACLLVDDIEQIVKTETLKINDIILVRPGEMIPIDGVIVDGSSSVDQSSMTGESIPKDVLKGDNVFAGTLNVQGILKVKVTKEADDTSLGKVVELLKEAEQSKTEIMRIIEEYSSYYLPLVIILAVIIFFITQDMNRVIAVLVVSCPCAQVLVSSTAMVTSLSVASRNGILIKNSAFLEVLGDIKTVIFDKTGTLTSGKLDVATIQPISKDVSKEEVLRIAAMAGWASKHPVSKAVSLAAENRGIEFEKVENIKEVAGMGVVADTNEGRIVLGKSKFLSSFDLNVLPDPETFGSLVWVSLDDNVLGYIILTDSVREDAKETIDDLKSIGVNRTILVTGDREDVANSIRHELNLDQVFASCLPKDKLDIVEREMENKTLTMVVGDGINDALALVKADIGIAMGAMGSDIAVKSSDIALMGNELKKLPFTIRLARAAKKTIYQNIVIAMTSSAIMIALAALGTITPLAGSLLHNVGAFLVVFNSARLLKFDQVKSNDSMFLDYMADIDPFSNS